MSEVNLKIKRGKIEKYYVGLHNVWKSVRGHL